MKGIQMYAICYLVLACGYALGRNEVHKSRSVTLRVALYPDLPDSVGDEFKSLLSFVKKEFESVYPHVNLKLRPMNDVLSFYNLTALTNWLSDIEHGYDIVEVDTILLGDLISTGTIAPQFVSDAQQADWHPAIIEALRYNHAIYAYPHLMCTTFLFTREEHVAKAVTIDDLVTALGNTPTAAHRLVGNLNSSWELPSLWIRSFQNSFQSTTNNNAFALHNYQNYSLDALRKFIQLCDRITKTNNCLDGTFRDQIDLPAHLLSQRQATSMFGYSERLFFMLRNSSSQDYNDIKVTLLPVGTKTNAALFTNDAFVFRRNMPNDLANAARLFVEFMATPRMQAAYVASGDSPKPNATPRYLLPASRKAYDDPLLINNRFYQEYFRNLTGSSNLGLGFYNIRKTLQKYILENMTTKV